MKASAIGRIGRVERHVRAAGLQRRRAPLRPSRRTDAGRCRPALPVRRRARAGAARAGSSARRARESSSDAPERRARPRRASAAPARRTARGCRPRGPAGPCRSTLATPPPSASGVIRSIWATGRSGDRERVASTASSCAARAVELADREQRHCDPSADTAKRTRPAGGSTPTPTDSGRFVQARAAAAPRGAPARVPRDRPQAVRAGEAPRARPTTAATAAPNGASRSSVDPKRHARRRRRRTCRRPATRARRRCRRGRTSKRPTGARRERRWPRGASRRRRSAGKRSSSEGRSLYRVCRRRRPPASGRSRSGKAERGERRLATPPPHARPVRIRPSDASGQCRREQRQRGARDETIASNDVGERDRRAVQLGEPAEHDIARPGRHLQLALLGERRPCRRRALTSDRRSPRRPTARKASPRNSFGSGKRVRLRAEVERAHQRRDLLGGRLPIDDGRRRGTSPATEVVPRRSGPARDRSHLPPPRGAQRRRTTRAQRRSTSR